ncbi:transposase, partial [Streptomyces atratus]|uniref:transposase n=1 Tax=Streptomyces atratus TaxID=1893 RepID=UPI0036C7D86D
SSDRAEETVKDSVLHTTHQVRHLQDQRAQDNDRKRHIATDTLGFLLTVIVTTASVSDRDAGRDLLKALRERHRHIRLVRADSGYTGWLVSFAHAALALALTVVKRSDDTTGFTVLPRRWCVERTFA